jgi:hypothetical protein
MTNHQRNVALSVAAVVLIVILFVLVMAGTLNAIVALVLTVIIGYGVQYLRRTLMKP